MARIKYRSAEVQEQRRHFAKKVAIISGTLLALIVVGTVFLLRIEQIQIREINIEGTNIINKNEITELVNQTLEGNYLWVIPKTNTFLYSVSKLNNLLIEKFPGIKSLNVGRNGLKGISIKIVERKPEALWCANAKENEIPQCYFVDSAGIVFAKAPFFSGNVYFMYRGDLGKEEPLGAQIFNAQDFSSFQSFVKQTTVKLGIPVVGTELKEQGDFDLILNSGLHILLNRNISYDDMYNNIDAIMKSPQFASSTLNSLEYIDMRFGNKIYFKPKTSQKVIQEKK